MTPTEDRRISIRAPARVAWPVVLVSSLVLLLLQLACGTDPAYALLTAGFVHAAALAFNIAGGLQTVPGFCVAMMAIKTVLLSQIVKVLLWQPADSYLERPLTTMAMFTVGFISMAAGIGLAGQRRSDPWIQPIANPRTLLHGAYVCGVVGLASALLIFRHGIDVATEEHARGGLLGLAHILVRVLPLSIVLSTAHVIVASDGKRSTSWLVLGTIATSMAFAAAQGTKQGVFETVVYYVLTCVAFGFSFRRRHLAILTFAGVIGIVVVWPILQTLKQVTLLTSISMEERVELITETLSDMKSIGDFFEASDTATEAFTPQDQFLYYGRSMGWVDRFSLIEPADELVKATDEQGELGWETPIHAVRGLVPAFIDPNKPIFDTGNMFGHRIGFLHPTDDMTQIAFGILPESYAAFRWTGLLIFPAVLLFIFVVVMRRLAGDLSSSVWTVYLFGRLQHTFVEQSISTFVRELFVLPLIMITIAAMIVVADEVRHRIRVAP